MSNMRQAFMTQPVTSLSVILLITGTYETWKRRPYHWLQIVVYDLRIIRVPCSTSKSFKQSMKIVPQKFTAGVISESHSVINAGSDRWHLCLHRNTLVTSTERKSGFFLNITFLQSDTTQLPRDQHQSRQHCLRRVTTKVTSFERTQPNA